jgi:hypothetical protein
MVMRMIEAMGPTVVCAFPLRHKQQLMRIAPAVAQKRVKDRLMKSSSAPETAVLANIQHQSSTADPRFVPLQSEPRWNGCGQPAAVHTCALVKQRGRQVLTAVRTTDDQARLFSWRINADGAVLCTGNLDVPVVDVVQVALVHMEHYITVCRTADGRLHLHSWDVSNTGAIYPRGAATLVANLTWFTVLPLTAQQLLTIGLDSRGHWQLTSWQVTAELAPTPIAERRLSATTGALAAVQWTPMTVEGTAEGAFSTLVTVMHSAPNRLLWTQWRYQPDGQLTPQAQIEHPVSAVVDLALTTVNGQLVTILHRADGRLQAWLGWPTTAPVDSEEIALAWHVRHFSVINEERAAALTVAAVTAPQPTQPMLTLQSWQATGRGWQSVGAGVLPVDLASELVLCPQPLDGHAPFLTATCTDRGALHLTTWRDQWCEVQI